MLQDDVFGPGAFLRKGKNEPLTVKGLSQFPRGGNYPVDLGNEKPDYALVKAQDCGLFAFESIKTSSRILWGGPSQVAGVLGLLP